MRKGIVLLAGAGMLLVAVFGAWFAAGWYGDEPIEGETSFVVSRGSTLTSVARKLEDEGLIGSADSFLVRAKIFGGNDPVQAGEFLLVPGMSDADILSAFQTGDVVRRMITIPEGMPSVLVYEKLNAEPHLTGEIPVPVEGTVLPDTYDFERGEERAKLLARMQAAMHNYMAEAWPRRSSRAAVKSMAEAVTLASIVEKETGLPQERRMVAGLYSNRVRKDMFLQADPTIIYPITKGKRLGRRIRQSEIAAINDYNTYAMAGLPKGPITNPGRESIAAVLDPAPTDALYMVADGSRGHAFSTTLEEHNANVEKWYALRRSRGEM